MSHALEFLAAETKKTTEKNVRNLKVVGGAQAVLGIVCIILNSVSVGQHIEVSGSLSLDVACLVLSFWFVLTGVFPLGMIQGKKNLWNGLKITFMVLSIIGSAVVAPGIIIIELILLTVNSFTNMPDATTVNKVIMCFVAIEFIIAIVSASICCCCSPLALDSKVQVLYPTNLPTTTPIQSRSAEQHRTDRALVLSYEEPFRHSVEYEEIGDPPPYEPLSDRNPRASYDQLDRQQTIGTDHQTAMRDLGTSSNQSSYLQLGPKPSDPKYDQPTEVSEVKGRHSYLELISDTTHSNLNKNGDINQQSNSCSNDTVASKNAHLVYDYAVRDPREQEATNVSDLNIAHSNGEKERSENYLDMERSNSYLDAKSAP